MDFLNEIHNELKQEATVTRKYLALVDFKHADYKPHKNSEYFGVLAIHTAELLVWWLNVLEENELNFANFKREEIKTTEELLNYFDTLLNKTLTAIKATTKDELKKEWTMSHGDETFFKLNKKEVLRKFCLNHLVHHRAQLGVYLKLLNIEVPATYGPSSTDWDIILTESFK